MAVVDGLFMLYDAAVWLSEQEKKETLIIDTDKKRTFEQVSGELWPTMLKKKRTLKTKKPSCSLRERIAVIKKKPSCSLKERIPDRGREDLRLVIKKKPSCSLREPGGEDLRLVIEKKPSCSLRERIAERGGEDLQLVIEKKLTLTDVSSGHGRLSMPSGSLRSRFLNDAEESQVALGIQVAVVDEQSREYKLRLKEWKMGNTRIFNLNGDWNSVVKRNAFAAHDDVQLWSFRHHSRLCFALVQLKDVDSHS